jgi:hypothetical protein
MSIALSFCEYMKFSNGKHCHQHRGETAHL